jgi:hypothetical protein
VDLADFAAKENQSMADHRDNGSTKARLTVRIEHNTLEEIERLAERRRTTPSQVGRVMLEDQLRALAGNAA